MVKNIIDLVLQLMGGVIVIASIRIEDADTKIDMITMGLLMIIAGV